MRRLRLYIIGTTSSLAMAGAAVAQETTTYTYDTQGRLTGSAISGGPNNTRTTATCFDTAGNRTQYIVALGAPPDCGTSTPTPSPSPTPTPSGNQPPVAGTDTATVACWGTATVNLTANDTDPEGNLPLSLVSISPNVATATTATIVSGSSVYIEAGNRQPGLSFTYVVQDNLGATSSGTLNVTITGVVKNCNNF